MEHPQYFYYLLLILMGAGEVAQRRRGREAFGEVLWVILGVSGASFVAYHCADIMGWQPSAYWSMFMPGFQIWLHALGFVIGILISRQLPGHLAAAIFLPMASVDLLRLLDMLWAITWWKSLYILALAQLLTLAVGADLHPVGRHIRKWAERRWQHLEMRVLAIWGARWI